MFIFALRFFKKGNIGPSSNGRTTDFGSVYVGSNPAGPTIKSASRKRADFLFVSNPSLLDSSIKHKKRRPRFADERMVLLRPPRSVDRRSQSSQHSSLLENSMKTQNMQSAPRIRAGIVVEALS